MADRLLVTCSDCGCALLPEDSNCPACGSANRTFYKVLDAAVGVEGSLKLKGRRGAPGEVRPHLVKTITREYWRDGKKWEEVVRTFDHEARTYEEIYRDPGTGEVRYRKEGSLDNQGLHGPRGTTSAKKDDEG